MTERDVIDEIVTRLPRRRRTGVALELQAHLEETRQELLASGWQDDEARRESVARLGDPQDIATAFGQVYRPKRRARLGLAFGLAGALLLGVYGTGALASATSAHKVTPRIKHAHVVRAHSSSCDHHATS